MTELSVHSLQARPHLLGRRIDLTWVNPTVRELAQRPGRLTLRIVRRQRTFALDSSDGEVIYDGGLRTAFSDRGLEPLTTYYYSVFLCIEADCYGGETARVAAMATADHQLAGRIYNLLPAAHRRFDKPLTEVDRQQLSPAVREALSQLPPALRERGQLYRFLQAAWAPLNLMRSLAEGLPQLHDADLARPEFLLPLAQWLGWDQDRSLPVYAQRNEIRAAPYLYRTVGTAENFAAIVTRYTGWPTQVAELAQSVARSNQPPQLNVFGCTEVAESGGGPTHWVGIHDAAPALGFGLANSSATSPALGQQATLTSTLTEPYELQPGMTLLISVDSRLTSGVRLHPDDFADITRATAAEVAAVLDRAFPALDARVAAGRLQLRTRSVSANASLLVENTPDSLVTLESALQGRLAPVPLSTGAQLLLFYEHRLLGEATLSQGSRGRIRYKVLHRSRWSAARSLDTIAAQGQAEPTAALLPGGRILLVFVEAARSAQARLVYRIGSLPEAQPARLVGRRTSTGVRPGMHILLRARGGHLDGIEFVAGDFSDPAAPTMDEIARALSARLTHARARVQPDLSLVLESVVTDSAGVKQLALGSEQELTLDLAASSAALALGFDESNASARGEDADRIAWEPEPAEPLTAPGLLAEPHLVALPDGSLRLYYSRFDQETWKLFEAVFSPASARWQAPQVALVAGGDFAHAREPHAIVDGNGRVHLFWSQRVARDPVRAADTWALHGRSLAMPQADPALDSWTAPRRLTFPEQPTALLPEPRPAALRDRQPSAILEAGVLRVFFQSTRNGSTALWSFRVRPDELLGGAAPTRDPAVELIQGSSAADSAPAPVHVQVGGRARLWMLFRSDRSVYLSQQILEPRPVTDHRVIPAPPQPPAPSQPPTPSAGRSVILPAGTALRRSAGSITLVPSDVTRLSQLRQWNDLISYTSHRPPLDLPAERFLDEAFYSRSTLGLFVRPLDSGTDVSQALINRLRIVLEQFLPIHLRAIVVLAPELTIEDVYRPGADIQESFLDNYPFADVIDPPQEEVEESLPLEWRLLRSNRIGIVSYDPTKPATLRFRTYIRPLR